MGFHHGSNEPPFDPEKQASIKDALIMTWVVFTVLAKPLAIILSAVGYLFLIFFMFGLHPIAGAITLSIPVGALIVGAFWEWRHPPELK